MAENYIEKNPHHRITKYSPSMLPTLIELMSKGKSKIEVCAHMMISEKTLNKWLNEDDKPELKEAVELGLTLSEAYMESEAKKNLHNKDFKDALWYKIMVNRYSWGDRSESIVNQTNTNKESLSDAELAERVKALLEKQKENE